MKYKSEVINEIIETGGHVKSTLHYQSECVETWIEEVRGAYPKLTDYEGEWLNYYLENEGVGEFPYLALTNITSATVDNCVPINFKSAILSGNTLVNLATQRNATFDKRFIKIPLSKTLDKGKKYLVKLKEENSTLPNGFYLRFRDNTSSGTTPTFNANVAYEVNLDKLDCLEFFTTNADDITNGYTATINDIIVIEYIDGMENWDIPYFEGMQSVKLPVLTTTGKNLFGGSLITTIDARRFELKGFELIEGEKYTLSYNCSKDGAKTHQLQYMTNNTSNPTHLSSATTSTNECKLYFTVPKDLARLFIYTNDWSSNLEHFSNIQIEQGIQTTSYEPFKSNILSTSEEVVLRGIGDVKDTLDCLTGELTQRVGEIVLDGSEEWQKNTSDFNSFYYRHNESLSFSKIITDNYPIINSFEDKTNGIFKGGAAFGIIKNDIENVEQLKQWLSENPITVQYQLATESIKTVDLSISNQDGESLNNLKAIEGTMYIETASETIKPLLDIEVPVEAIIQNLNSFIEEE